LGFLWFYSSNEEKPIGIYKGKKLVYIHNTLRLLAWKDPRYKKGPSKKWDKYINDVICVDNKVKPNGLMELTTITNTANETKLENDDHLQIILTED
jgi:hypothetical protein